MNNFRTRVFQMAVVVSTFLFSREEIFISKVYAANESPQVFTLDGILYEKGGTKALTDASVQIKVQFLNPNLNCILYEETQVIDTSSTKGYFNILVGSALGAAKRSANDSGNSLSQVFQNISAIVAKSVPGQSCAGLSYTPSSGDQRYIRLIVTPSSTGVSDTLSPDISIGNMPVAIVAQTLQGIDRSQFLLSNTAGSISLNQTNLESLFTGTAYTNLQKILNGEFLSTDSSGATLPSYASTPAGVSEGDLWYDSSSHELKYKSNSGVVTLNASGGGSSSGVASISSTSDVLINGSSSASSVSGGVTIGISDTGVVAGSYSKVTVDAKGRVTTGASISESDLPTISTAGKVSGSALTSGTISGTTAVNTSGNIVTSGTVTGASVFANSFRFYNGSNYVQVSAPTLASNWNFSWPTGDGTSGQVLKTDGAGQLFWASTSSNLALNNGQIFVGNASNVATSVSLSGDATLSNSGVLTLGTVSVSKGGTGSTSFTANKIILSNGTGSSLTASSCSLNQVISFDASGNVSCANISSLAGMILNGGNSTGGSISLGTNDNQPLLFKTNNSTAVTISQNGYLGIGGLNPQAALDVTGSVLFDRALGSSQNGKLSVGGAVRTHPTNSASNYAEISHDDNDAYIKSYVGTNSFRGNIILQPNSSSSGSQGYVGVGTTSPSVMLDVAGSAQLRGQGVLRLADSSSTHYVGLKSPSSVTSNVTWTLPGADGTSGQVLSTDGAGVLSWTTPSGGGGSSFSNGGNSFGASAVIGTSDNHSLTIKTNNTTAFTVSQTGAIGIGPNFPWASVGGRLNLIDAENTSDGVVYYMMNTSTATHSKVRIQMDGAYGLVGGIIEVDGKGSGYSGQTSFNLGTSTQTPISFVTGGSTVAMTISQGGNVGIGTLAPTAKLHVSTSSTSGNIATFVSTGGGGAGCSIAWNGTSCSSDVRLKENITDLESSITLENLLRIRPVNFTWKADSKHERQTGFIAQELEKIFPEFVKTDDQGLKQVNYAHFVSVVVSALQEMHKNFNHEKEEIQKNNTEINLLKQEIEILKQQNKQFQKYICETSPQSTFCQ